MLNNQRLLNLMTVGLLIICAAPTFAQSTANPSVRFDSEVNRVLFKPPSDDKQPDHRVEAGSRHPIPCLQDANSTTLMNSSSNQNPLIPLTQILHQYK